LKLIVLAQKRSVKPSSPVDADISVSGFRNSEQTSTHMDDRVVACIRV